MTTAEQYAARAALVSSESARLLDYFRSLSPDDWQTQSACDAWSNADVAAHLIMAVEMFSGNIARGAQGDATPPEGMGPPQETDLPARMAANATRAVSVRESLGDSLVETFAEHCQRLDALLAGMGPDDWDKPCYHPAAMLTVGKYIDLRLTEMAVHEWDIRSRLEPSAKLPDALIPPALDLMPGFVVGRLFQPGAGIPHPSRFRFRLTAPASLPTAAFDIVAGGGELRMEPNADGDADVTFTCDGSTFALLAYGRLNVADATADGSIAIEGARELAAQF